MVIKFRLIKISLCFSLIVALIYSSLMLPFISNNLVQEGVLFESSKKKYLNSVPSDYFRSELHSNNISPNINYLKKVDNLWLQIELNLGDAYVNSIVTSDSLWYTSGDNALGPPDGIFAIIFPDYGNGYLTLDMGEGEEIIDGNGSDFTVIADGGEYSVWIGNNLESSFIKIGNGIGNQSFDLTAVNSTNVRYLRIVYYSDANVALDAIVAANYNELESSTFTSSLTTSTNKTPFPLVILVMVFGLLIIAKRK